MSQNVTTTAAFDALRNDHGIVLDVLKDAAEKGHTIYGVVHSVAKSGMSRTMSLYVLSNGDMVCINHLVAEMGLGKRADHGFRISGAGMDMGFHVTYALGVKLFGDGYALSSPRYL